MRSPWLPLVLSILPGLSALGATPGMDELAQATVLSDSAIIVGDFSDGTAGESDPPAEFDTAGQTLWWKFQATKSGRVRLTVTADGGKTPSLTTFRQEADGTLTTLGDNLISNPCLIGNPLPRDAVIAFEANPGETVVLRADIPSGRPSFPWEPPLRQEGRFEARLDRVDRPANDSPSHAVPLPAELGRIESDLFAASPEVGEPLTIPKGKGRSVWYRWKAPSRGELTLWIGPLEDYAPEITSRVDPPAWTTVEGLNAVWPILTNDFGLPIGYPGMGPDPAGGITVTGVSTTMHTGCERVPNPLLEPVLPVMALCRPDATGAPERVADGGWIRTVVEAGSEWWLGVDTAQGEAGLATVFGRFIPAPANDDFANAVKLSGPSVTAEGHTIAATREGFEGTGDGSAWWTWTAAMEGPVEILNTSPYERSLSLGIGLSVSGTGPTQMRSAMNRASFYAEPGRTYAIAVAGPSEAGAYRFQLRQLPARLRPVLNSPGAPHSELGIGEVQWAQGLLQKASLNGWVDATLLQPPAIPAGRKVLGFRLAAAPEMVGELPPNPGQSGSYRFWALDFELPASELTLHAFNRSEDGRGNLSIHLHALIARQLILESSPNLAVWQGESPLRSQPGGTEFFLDVDPAPNSTRTFRTREILRSPEALLAPQ